MLENAHKICLINDTVVLYNANGLHVTKSERGMPGSRTCPDISCKGTLNGTESHED